MLSGGPGHDVIRGGSRGDTPFVDSGADDIDGGQHADLIYGSQGPDVLRGGHGHDTLTGGPAADVMRGQDGNDEFWAGDGTKDVVRGGPGIDGVGASDLEESIKGTEYVVWARVGAGPERPALTSGCGTASSQLPVRSETAP
jgi:hypothetical protein